MNPCAWLERLAFSLVILGVWLWWEAYRIYTNRAVGTSDRVAVYTVVGALLVGVGLAGIRLRHRPKN